MKSNTTTKPKSKIKKLRGKKRTAGNQYSVEWIKQSFKVRLLTWLESIWTAIRYFPGEHYPSLVKKDKNELSWLAYSENNKPKTNKNTTWTYSNKWD